MGDRLGFPRVFNVLPGNIVALLFYCLAYRHVIRDRVGLVPSQPGFSRPGNMSNDILGKQYPFIGRQFLQGWLYRITPLRNIGGHFGIVRVAAARGQQ